MSDTCPDCHSTDVADLVDGGRICLDCDRVWGAGRSGHHPAEPLDLTELSTIADMADFLNEPITMSPAQLRTILAELAVHRAGAELVFLQVKNLRAAIEKIMLERDKARWALIRIVDEFGDYDALLQSREIFEGRSQILRSVRKMHTEFTSPRYNEDHLRNAAFGAVVTTLGNVLDGAAFDPDLARLMDLATKCMHPVWVFANPSGHPDEAVQVCGSCGIERDEADHDNGSNAITRKAWMKKMGLTES